MDNLYVAASEHCIDRRFCLIAMRLRIGPPSLDGDPCDTGVVGVCGVKIAGLVARWSGISGLEGVGSESPGVVRLGLGPPSA